LLDSTLSDHKNELTRLSFSRNETPGTYANPDLVIWTTHMDFGSLLKAILGIKLNIDGHIDNEVRWLHVEPLSKMVGGQLRFMF